MEQAEKKHILIVDDMPDNIDLLAGVLKKDYDIKIALNGEKALELVSADTQIEVVLLDIIMTGMDGYETCRQIKSNADTKDIEIIFISALDSEDAIVKGYESGATDYLTKPIKTEEVIQKVQLCIKNRELRLAMENEKKLAFETAMTAMTSSGEQGVVLEFMRNSFTINDIETLASKIIEANNSYGLRSSVLLRTSLSEYYASSDEPIPPLEKEFLYKVADVGRLRESRGYFIANYGGVTLLIKNMPDDEDKRGRFRDHIAILAEGADSKLQSIGLVQGLKEIVQNAKNELHEIEALQKNQKEMAVQIMDNVLADLEASFMSYGLTEDQEEMLLDVVRRGVESSLDNFEKSLIIDEKINNIISQLEIYSKG